MQVRNLLIAAGATLAGLTAIAAAPTAASAQGYYRPAYAAPYRVERSHEIRRIEARRHWEHRRMAEYRFHHRPGFYRY
jgi:hypothetical protein